MYSALTAAVGSLRGPLHGGANEEVMEMLGEIPSMDAVEPYIMASVGVPKYALVPLFILWFGIDDAPKLWLVGLLVFYPIFIAVFAGIRNVDRRLISMARVLGASEAAISREVIWNSLLPFFFAALKIAKPSVLVTFWQHLISKPRSRVFGGTLFVACAASLVNGVRATEGGIPSRPVKCSSARGKTKALGDEAGWGVRGPSRVCSARRRSIPPRTKQRRLR